MFANACEDLERSTMF